MYYAGCDLLQYTVVFGHNACCCFVLFVVNHGYHGNHGDISLNNTVSNVARHLTVLYPVFSFEKFNALCVVLKCSAALVVL